MAVRTALFLLPAALLLVPAAVVAQTPSPAAPAEVEQALRTRVTEFFQDFVDGKFRQAINLVAEDTQDEYFSGPKAEIKAFQIDQISYSDDFAKATVTLKVKQVWRMKAEGFMQEMVVDSSMPTTWRIENGKWVFYHHIEPGSWITPMGPSDIHKPDGATVMPKSLDSATLNSEAQRILHSTNIDKDTVTLAPDKLSSSKVVFHNGVQGSVSVSVVGVPPFPGFSAKFEKQDVNAGQDAVLEISYNPPADAPSLPNSFTIAVEVAPFNQHFPIQVTIGAPPK
jgi:hypothetical protein